MEKHPAAIPASPSILLDSSSETQHYDPIIFDCITGDLIKKASLNTHGAAGPSGVDAYAWRRMCTSFGEASVGLCEALASVARRICTAHLVPSVLMPFLSCRLIPLDKCPGVRPIGIGDVPIGLCQRQSSMPLVMILYWMLAPCRLVLVMRQVLKQQFMQ